MNSVNSKNSFGSLSIKKNLYQSSLLLIYVASALHPLKEEGQKIAEAERKSLVKTLFNEDAEDLPNDGITSSFQGVPLDPDVALQHVNSKASSPEGQEVTTCLKNGSARERIEKEEGFLKTSVEVDADPFAPLEISSEQTQAFPEEISLATCQESGSYQMSIDQQLQITISPEIKQQTKLCQGHSKTSTYTWKKEAHQARRKLHDKLSNDPSIQESSVAIPEGGLLHRYVVEATWTHRPNTPCSHHRIEEVIIEPKKEEDSWITDNPRLLDSLQTDPGCHLLYSQLYDGPQTRTIQGQPLYRDAWKRTLYFACGGEENPKCKSLRETGAVLVHKKCLQETEFGECRRWEKTYDLGCKGAYHTTTLSFQGREIWGLESHEMGPPEKNRDLPEVATTLSIFAELKKELEESPQGDSKHIHVFKGEPFKCQRSFIHGALYDCCQKMNGLAIQAKLAHCNSEEKCLSQKRFSGHCHFIGTRKEKLGTEVHQVFCCFQSKLARIIHEEGRRQLGLSWGSATHPKCRGFSVEELQRIDFSKIDLSEALADLPISPDDFLRKLTGTADRYQNNPSLVPKITAVPTGPQETHDK